VVSGYEFIKKNGEKEAFDIKGATSAWLWARNEDKRV
jgi:hypothetical protein